MSPFQISFGGIGASGVLNLTFLCISHTAMLGVYSGLNVYHALGIIESKRENTILFIWELRLSKNTCFWTCVPLKDCGVGVILIDPMLFLPYPGIGTNIAESNHRIGEMEPYKFFKNGSCVQFDYMVNYIQF